MAAVPMLKLSSGYEMPAIGLGTWKSQGGNVEVAVKAAIDCGYRHIDCAFIYSNEGEVGNALQVKLKDGTVTREDLFITTKLWNTFHRPDLVASNLKKSLADLQLDFVDLYLMHWPMAYKEGDETFPKDADGKFQFSDVDFIETWKAMEKLVDEGLAKSIGVANFNPSQIQRILDLPDLKHKPVNNQVEIHPYLANSKLVEFCKSKDIVVTAYSPLSSPDRPWAKKDDPNLLEDPALVSIAKKYNKSSAQVILRWGVQRGYAVIPKSVTPSRIEENIKICDFELTQEEMDVVFKMNKNFRACQLEWVKDHPHYPFSEGSSPAKEEVAP